METKEIIRSIREKNNLTQEQFAERIHVTRQAVSRWENGETLPDTEQLKTLSRVFGVSINTLLGSPQTLYCQCCGMPLSDDTMISRETDGSFNEDYCKWCYADGNFTLRLASLDVEALAIERNDDQWTTPWKSKENTVFLCFSLCLYYLCTLLNIIEDRFRK